MLLDIMMPDVDGGEVANQMKADDETSDIPIVFVSGAITKDEAKEQGSIQSGYPIIAKPVLMNELMEVIGKYIPEKPKLSEDYAAPSMKAKEDILSTDRRKHTRIQTGGRLSYTCLDKNDNPQREGVGDAVNVSKIGLQLKTQKPIETEYVQLIIKNIENELMKIKGKVVYTKMSGPGMFHIGVNFSEPVEKVHQFVVTLVKKYNLEKAAEKTP
jgi:response regulator RpfG family c-di-GMP phosphodiesterase